MKKDTSLPPVDESVFKQSHIGGHRSGPRKLRGSVRDICEELGCNPVELVVNIINGDYEALGFSQGTSIRTDREGNPIAEIPNITPELRLQAAKTMMDFIYSKNFTLKGDKDNPIEFKGKAELDYAKLAQMVKAAKGE